MLLSVCTHISLAFSLLCVAIISDLTTMFDRNVMNNLF